MIYLCRVVPFGPIPTCTGRSLTIGIHHLATITPKYAVNPHLTMSSPTDGSGVLQWSLVLMRDVLGALPSPLTSGQNMPLVDRDVPCNVFLPKARCTSPPSAMPVAS
mmetsp:Transcript_38138/g.68761  ORF Transcript_38138/g.68761 Transcript_38138/m.68761 type:complete len:107 (+) Transcript_38138:160-480(+)